MANNDAAFGLAVWGQLLRARMYAVQTEPVINVFHGDLVIHAGVIIATAFGPMNIIADAAVPDDTAGIIGAVVAIFDEDMDPIPYIPLTDAGDGTVAGYIMVADHPDQEFLIQEDGVGTPIPLSKGGMNCDYGSATTKSLGTAATGVSLAELDSSTVGSGSDIQLKLHYPHLEDTVNSAYCRWVVSINEHYYGDTMAGIS